MATRSAASRTSSAKGPKVTKASLERFKRQIPLRLEQIRGDRSQRSFARELGVFQQNVNRYENGTTPHADFLITLAIKENISLDWLLLGKGKQTRRN
ncbi:MAG: bacteriophage CI repressor [bacterium]|nr:bacteriophage CI repressor [bacterium]